MPEYRVTKAGGGTLDYGFEADEYQIHHSGAVMFYRNGVLVRSYSADVWGAVLTTGVN